MVSHALLFDQKYAKLNIDGFVKSSQFARRASRWTRKQRGGKNTGDVEAIRRPLKKCRIFQRS
jgi:hypothetical protein